MSNPEAVTVPEPEEGAMSVPEVLAQVGEEVCAQHRAYVDAVRTKVLIPLQEAVKAAEAIHVETRQTLTESLEAETADRLSTWNAVRTYRQTVAASVWAPIQEALAAAEVGTVLRRERFGLRRIRRTVAEHVPDSVTRPEPPDLYAIDPVDDPLRRLRKATVRGTRAARKWAGRDQPPMQTIPLARLVAHHATVRIREAESGVLDDVEQRLALWVARLERTAARWTHRVLEAEFELDAAAFHHPSGGAREAGTPADLPPPLDPASPIAAQAAVMNAADGLDACLAAGRALGLDDLEATLDEVVITAGEALRRDVDRADSFMAHRPSARPPRRLRRLWTARDARTEAWTDWYGQVLDRLQFLSDLTDMREDRITGQNLLGTTALVDGVAPARTVLGLTIERLAQLEDDVAALLTDASESPDRVRLRQFDHLVETAVDDVETVLDRPLGDLAPRRNITEAVHDQTDAMRRSIAAQPERFIVHSFVDADADWVDPQADPQEIRWRDGVRDALEAGLLDDWKAATPLLISDIEAVIAAASEVPEIIRFNLNAALEELQDWAAARARNADGAEHLDGARELALGGVRRCLDVLQAGDIHLADAVDPFIEATWAATRRAWSRLHARARAAGQTREHVLRAQSMVQQRVRSASDRLRTTLRAGRLWTQRTFYRVRRHLRSLVHFGQSAVSGPTTDRSALQETVEALSTVDDVLAGLPLVYRRLFSFRPVLDPALLVGRDTDLAMIRRHVDEWQRGLANALILTGAPGSGLTSTLNVLTKTTFRAARRHHVVLTERIRTEAEIAERIAEELGIPRPAGEAITLDAVSKQLMQQDRPQALRVCFIEHLEHLLLRTVGGTELFARVLSFLSETDTRVLWISTMGTAAWQFIVAAEPDAVGLVVQHALDPLDRQELEELIMCRHRRSGLRLVFDVPDESSHPILSRRVQAARDSDRQQALLRTEFFDRLYTSTGQNVMLALFYWFRSVRLDAETGTLRVAPLRPITFDALERFTLPQTFALKALLEHATLTVDELAEAAQTTTANSRALLEAVGNAQLIAPAETGRPPGVYEFTSVQATARYRIRPLVVHPVVRFLRSRNIVH